MTATFGLPGNRRVPAPNRNGTSSRGERIAMATGESAAALLATVKVLLTRYSIVITTPDHEILLEHYHNCRARCPPFRIPGWLNNLFQ
ncbi:hypothetical protein AB0M12_00200 [Nocardia vinacea]|uniref:hypothetical protein n=1 Tax=Nocardia vinacea TaxID=96468 RepID=UPI0034450E65